MSGLGNTPTCNLRRPAPSRRMWSFDFQKHTNIYCKGTVPLCRILRWNGEESCFTKFHKDKVLVNPSNVPEQLCTTRKNDNRAPPPSRKRKRSPDIPNRRSSSTRIPAQERRRSLRLHDLR
ncbi:hypothetical protein L917_10739 [Phytophthora nicotianae]|uniref:Uncharacterized protein n=1 Tax=Phytophthora nicotianae TaxID=4792 RepID=W2KZT6_PHYNI|nr:hypothetical protein L917_10739 [Phytophthora nicotianae]